MNPEKKERRTLTLADHVAVVDARIAATEAKLKKLQAQRRVLLVNATAKAEAALEAARKAAAGTAL